MGVMACGFLLLLVRSLPGARSSTTKPVEKASSARRKAEPFEFLSRDAWYARSRASGILIKAAYLTRPVHEVMDEVKREQGSRKVALFICNGPQRKQMSTWLSLSDEICIFLYHLTSDKPPKPGELIWPGYNNPLINRVREVRHTTANKKLLATFSTIGSSKGQVWGISRTRRLVFEELQWMTFAAIGGNYQGVIWRQCMPSDLPDRRLSRVEASIKTHARDLGMAHPVGWVEAPKNQPASSLCSDNKLFVVLLNPAYMAPNPDGKTISVPLEPGSPRGEITIRVPAGCALKSGTYLDGRPLRLLRDQDTVRVKYRFRGGGEMLIFDLSRDSAEGPNSPTIQASESHAGVNHE